MHAEVSAFKKSGTITFNWTKSPNSEIRIYTKLRNDNLWFLILKKLKLQHAFSTRIKGPNWMNPRTYG